SFWAIGRGGGHTCKVGTRANPRQQVLSLPAQLFDTRRRCTFRHDNQDLSEAQDLRNVLLSGGRSRTTAGLWCTGRLTLKLQEGVDLGIRNRNGIVYGALAEHV